MKDSYLQRWKENTFFLSSLFFIMLSKGGVILLTEMLGYPSPMMPSNFAATKTKPGRSVASANVWF